MYGSRSGSGRGSRGMRMSSFGGKPRFRKKGNNEITTKEEVPERLEKQAQEHLEKGEEIKVAVSTDLRFDGTYGKDWLLITDKRLIAFNQNGVLGHNLTEVSLDSIEDIEILEMYGNNILKVITSENACELARYSKKLTPKFNRTVSELEKLSSRNGAGQEKNAGIEAPDLAADAVDAVPECGIRRDYNAVEIRVDVKSVVNLFRAGRESASIVFKKANSFSGCSNMQSHFYMS